MLLVTRYCDIKRGIMRTQEDTSSCDSEFWLSRSCWLSWISWPSCTCWLSSRSLSATPSLSAHACSVERLANLISGTGGRGFTTAFFPLLTFYRKTKGQRYYIYSFIITDCTHIQTYTAEHSKHFNWPETFLFSYSSVLLCGACHHCRRSSWIYQAYIHKKNNFCSAQSPLWKKLTWNTYYVVKEKNHRR